MSAAANQGTAATRTIQNRAFRRDSDERQAHGVLRDECEHECACSVEVEAAVGDVVVRIAGEHGERFSVTLSVSGSDLLAHYLLVGGNKARGQ